MHKYRKLLLVVVVLCFLCAWAATDAQASSGKTGGTCGDGVKWLYDENTCQLIISGSGYMDSCPWSRYADQIKRVTIEYGVNNIVSNAFRGCTNLREVYIGNTVKVIEAYAFYGCSFSTIRFPESLQTIGSYAFGDFGSLSVYFFGDAPFLLPNAFEYNVCLYCPDDNDTYDRFVSTYFGEVGCSYMSYHSLEAHRSCDFPYIVDSQDPTCTEDGVRMFACWYCGNTKQEVEQGSALGHDFGEWYAVILATEFTEGQERHDCSRCDEFEIRAIPKLEHNHRFDTISSTIDATCTEPGAVVYVCACGESQSQMIEASGHDWQRVRVDREPTCVELGLAINQCMRCGLTEAETMPVADHDYVTKIVEPTCTQQGFTSDRCRVCDKYKRRNYTPALGHYISQFPTVVNATCTEMGSESYYCIRCEYLDRRTWIPATGHSYELTYLDPTCEEAGGTAYVCHCGDRYFSEKIDPLGHNFGEWQTVTEATADSEGLEKRVCLRCIRYESRVIPKIEHTHQYEAVVSTPSCTIAGYTTYICDCGDQYVEGELAPLGHDFSGWFVVLEATDVMEGIEKRSCLRCGESETRSIPKLEHAHYFVPIVTEPECAYGGHTTYTCSCGEGYVGDYTDALGHDYIDGTCTRCGEADPNYTAPVVNPFTDVKERHYFYQPVLWAVENGITSGTSATAFSPDDFCTRGQVVTFLWRAMGQPEPESNDNPFTDVREKDYFYKAVLWAVENGITAGTGEGKFSPKEECTRGQVVTFLWRAMGRIEPENQDNPFGDVRAKDYFCQPVLWAVENGITSGTGAGKFSPADSCTRGQVVTFLYRAMASE